MDDLASLLLERIRRVFPELGFEHAELIDHGEDHQVVVLDGAWVFRFPRNAAYLASFPAELALLAALSAQTPVPTPVYEWVAPDRSFGGYRRLPGEALTASRFHGMDRGGQEALITQLADFLRVLHAMAGGPPRTDEGWRAAEVGDYVSWRRARLAPRIDAALLARIDRAHQLYAAVEWERSAVIHGDFTSAHILIEPGARAVSGVIDFGDAVVGDPAFDFTLFHGLADWAPAFALDAYGDGNEGMLMRSAFSFIRYAAARLSDSEAAPGEATAAIERALRRVGL
jgi:aminoglycoside 2''-phosphotransferase